MRPEDCGPADTWASGFADTGTDDGDTDPLQGWGRVTGSVHGRGLSPSWRCAKAPCTSSLNCLWGASGGSGPGCYSDKPCHVVTSLPLASKHTLHSSLGPETGAVNNAEEDGTCQGQVFPMQTPQPGVGIRDGSIKWEEEGWVLGV